MYHLFRLLATQPDLLAGHAQAYAELTLEDATSMSADVMQKALWYAGLVCCVSVGVALAGVAAMLWATLPEDAFRAPWVLWATPLVPLVAALGCLAGSKRTTQAPAFAQVRQQMAADMQMLREVGTP